MRYESNRHTTCKIRAHSRSMFWLRNFNQRCSKDSLNHYSHFWQGKEISCSIQFYSHNRLFNLSCTYSHLEFRTFLRLMCFSHGWHPWIYIFSEWYIIRRIGICHFKFISLHSPIDTSAHIVIFLLSIVTSQAMFLDFFHKSRSVTVPKIHRSPTQNFEKRFSISKLYTLWRLSRIEYIANW